MLDADAVINNSSQKVGGSNAYPDPAPKKSGWVRTRPCLYTPTSSATHDRMRYEMLYVRSKADTSPLNLPHGTDNE